MYTMYFSSPDYRAEFFFIAGVVNLKKNSSQMILTETV